VRIDITTETGPAPHCVQVMWTMAGPAVNSAAGTHDNAPLGSTTGPDVWIPVACPTPFPIDPEAGPALPDGPAPSKP